VETKLPVEQGTKGGSDGLSEKEGEKAKGRQQKEREKRRVFRKAGSWLKRGKKHTELAPDGPLPGKGAGRRREKTQKRDERVGKPLKEGGEKIRRKGGKLDKVVREGTLAREGHDTKEDRKK